MTKETDQMEIRSRPHLFSAWSGVALVFCLAALMSLSAHAEAAISIGGFGVTTSETAAGGHPDLRTAIALENAGAPEAASDVVVDLPEGLFGNPNAIDKCSSSDFALTQCPITSQAGLVTILANYQGDPSHTMGTAPLFVVAPQSNQQTMRFGFIVPTVNIPISIPVTLRTASDYGPRLAVSGISQQIPLALASITVWGVPSDLAHADERFGLGSPGHPAGCPGAAGPTCVAVPHSSPLSPRPLTDNPTVCTGKSLVVRLRVTTYQDPGHTSEAESAYPPTTDCENETFKPFMEAGLTSGDSDSPAGMDLQLKAAQFLGRAVSPSTIRSATVTLPEGLTVNPDAADGQTACTDAEARFDSEAPATCPDSSKIGNFDVETPALDGPLTGSLYFGEPKPGDQYRVLMIASGFGINAKFVASVHPDPATGQLTISLTDLPQTPFESFNVHLFASDRGLMATPTRCSLYRVESLFVPWNDQLASQHSEAFLSVDSGPDGSSCPGQSRPFHPRLVAGMSTPVAGAFSNFHLKLDRNDGDQFLGDLNFTMPPGFTGDLRGISYCPEASIALAIQSPGLREQSLPSCPAASQIGTTNVAAGPGSHPFHAIGRMYLGGPFKGAPLSLVAVTPALAGPYDYGTQVVRVALHIDPLTAQVRAASDTVPSIIGGVPIRLRSIQVSIDRERFTINPTNCSPLSVDSQGVGDEGTSADFSSYFHAVNCASLGFKPTMSVRQVGGPKSTRRSVSPHLQFDLRTRPGDANIKSLSVTLPSAFAIDQRHLGNICSEKELIEKQCAGRTPIGKASTTTPLLDQPLSGPVYAVSGSGGLPKLAFILNGQVNLLPRAETKTMIGSGGAGRLLTTVPVVPDAPIGHFHLNVFGGKTSYLVNTKNLCDGRRPIIDVSYMGQNGRTYAQKVKVGANCGKKRKAAKHRRRGRSGR